jgi:hypothetical protein
MIFKESTTIALSLSKIYMELGEVYMESGKRTITVLLPVFEKERTVLFGSGTIFFESAFIK